MDPGTSRQHQTTCNDVTESATGRSRSLTERELYHLIALYRQAVSLWLKAVLASMDGCHGDYMTETLCVIIE